MPANLYPLRIPSGQLHSCRFSVPSSATILEKKLIFGLLFQVCKIWKLLIKADFERLAIITWGLWKNRMSVVYGNEIGALRQSLDWCNSLFKDFQESNRKLHINNHAINSSSTPQICTMPSDILQLEVDACVNANLQKFGIGGVIMDPRRRIIIAFGQQISSPLSVVDGELQAIHEGLKIANARGFRRLRVVSDSLISMQAVTNIIEDYHYTGARIQQIKNLMHENQTLNIRALSY